MKRTFRVEKDNNLYDFLAMVTVGLTKNRIASQVKKGEVRVNGTKVKENLTLRPTDEVSIFLPESLEVNPVIIYSDDNIAVVNKGICTDVEGGLTLRLEEIFGYAKPLHRLDRNTTGLVAFALNKGAEEELTAAFKEGRVQKIYMARTVKRIENGIYEAYLKKDSDKAKVTISSEEKPNYKHIKTGIEFVENAQINLAKIRLFTGRTHQIRAHLAHLGCPVLGDDKYGDVEMNKKFGQTVQNLKSVSLCFNGLRPPLSYLNDRVFSIENEVNF